MSTEIYHSAFARYTRIRRVAHVRGDTCDWCGGTNARGQVYQYGTEHDDSGRQSWDEHRFCSVACMRAYHDVKETP